MTNKEDLGIKAELIVPPDTPRQTTENNCGYYVSKYAENLILKDKRKIFGTAIETKKQFMDVFSNNDLECYSWDEKKKKLYTKQLESDASILKNEVSNLTDSDLNSIKKYIYYKDTFLYLN